MRRRIAEKVGVFARRAQFCGADVTGGNLTADNEDGDDATGGVPNLVRLALRLHFKLNEQLDRCVLQRALRGPMAN